VVVLVFDVTIIEAPQACEARDCQAGHQEAGAGETCKVTHAGWTPFLVSKAPQRDYELSPVEWLCAGSCWSSGLGCLNVTLSSEMEIEVKRDKLLWENAQERRRIAAWKTRIQT